MIKNITNKYGWKVHEESENGSIFQKDNNATLTITMHPKLISMSIRYYVGYSIDIHHRNITLDYLDQELSKTNTNPSNSSMPTKEIIKKIAIKCKWNEIEKTYIEI